MIDNATKERIYAAADIVDVVSDFVTLKKKGINYQACCPFHNEKTPSFVVSPAKGMFKCFGCNKGGNAVTFVMEHESLTYPEALKWVAKKYGIEVEEREITPEEERRNNDRESMMVVSSYASDFFEKTLRETAEGEDVGMAYLRQRSFSEVVIRKFALGYCPVAGDTFTQAALAAGYKEEFLTATGLTIKRETGGYYDRFAGRVIFPIHSISGRVIAFGGRALRSDKGAKYLNSPESQIYHKSDILYGLYFAKRVITQEDACLLVEGYTDVISLHQAGIENVVASSGTSLTEGQIRMIGRFTRNVTVLYDGDPAGIRAALRGIDMFLREGLNVRVVLLPDGDDPDSFAQKHSATELKAFIRTYEEDFIAFKSRLLLDEAGSDPIKKAGMIKDIVASIAEIPDPIVRSVYVKQTARTFDMEEALLLNEVARKRMSYRSDPQTGDFIRRQQAIQREEHGEQGQDASGSAPIPSLHPGSSMEELEKELIKYLLKYGHENFDYKEGRNIVSLNVAEVIISDLQNNGITFQDVRYRTIYDDYVCLRASGEEVVAHHFINHADPAVCNATVDILTSDDNYTASKLWKKYDISVGSEQERLAVALPRAVILYKSKAIEHIIQDLQRRLTASDELFDEEQSEIMYRIAALSRERMAIAKKLSRVIL